MDLKICFLSASLAVSAQVAVATPSVEDVSLSQAPDSCLVTVSYTLGSEPAIVTFDIQTNRTGTSTFSDADWVSVGEPTLTNAFGDVNCFVPSGARRIFWRADDTWEGNLVAQGAARAVVKAWSTNTPPDYLVVDLRRDSDRRYSPEPRVRYFTSTNALPYGGIASDAYRNEYIAMRRIPSQGVKWCMGSAETEVVRASNETQHYVTFTNADFYMAVFPLTRGQVLNFGTLATGDPYGLIDVKLSSGTWLYQYIACYGTTNEAPVCVPSCKVARGGTEAGVDWPGTGHAVSADSV